MSPVQRTLSSDALTFDLHEEMRIVGTELGAESSRIARTLVKEGAMRVTLIGIKAGGAMHEHVAPGPITIQVLAGEIILEAKGEEMTLGVGGLAALDHGVRHAVRSPGGGYFLLTHSMPERGAP
jgi:quercetin dioxygenase-like cupin family protein